MIADWTTGDKPQDDAEWAWFAEAYRKVPEPQPETVAHAVHTALHAAGTAAAWHSIRVVMWWILGTGAGVGLVLVGRSLVKSGETAPMPARNPPPASPVVPSLDSAPVVAAPKVAPPRPAPFPVPPAAPEPRPTDVRPDTPAITVDSTTVDSTGAIAQLEELAAMSGVDLERIRAGLGEPALQSLAILVHDAARAGLPWMSLFERATAGVAEKQAPWLILETVERRIALLREAQDALGMDASHEEINVGADALEAGATAPQLEEVTRSSRPGRAIVHLLTLGSLIADGVPASAAVEAVVQCAHAEVSDSALLALRTDVAADIARGIPPLTALHARVRSLGADSAPPPSPPLPGPPP